MHSSLLRFCTLWKQKFSHFLVFTLSLPTFQLPISIPFHRQKLITKSITILCVTCESKEFRQLKTLNNLNWDMWRKWGVLKREHDRYIDEMQDTANKNWMKKKCSWMLLRFLYRIKFTIAFNLIVSYSFNYNDSCSVQSEITLKLTWRSVCEK